MLRDGNHPANSLAYLASKIDLEIPCTMIIEVRDEPTYTCAPEFNVVIDINIPYVDIKDTWMNQLLDFLLKNKLLELMIEAHKIPIKAKRYIIINKILYHKSASRLTSMPSTKTSQDRHMEYL